MVSEKYRNFYRNKRSSLDGLAVHEHISNNLWISSILISFPSFLLGYSIVSFNPCLATGENNNGSACFDGSDTSCPPGSVYNDINLSTIEASLGNSLVVAGSWLATIFEAYPTERFGRRPTIMMTCCLFIIGAALTASSHSVYTLLIGRAISGIGVGFASGVPVVLLAEIATDATRGTITSMHQIMLTWGIFAAGLLSYGFIIYVKHGWQYLQGMSALPAIALLICHQYIPESPKWLLMNHLELVDSSEDKSPPNITPDRASPDSVAFVSQEEPSTSSSDHVLVEHSVNTSFLNEECESVPPSPYLLRAEEILSWLRSPRYDIQQEIHAIIESIEKNAASEEDISWKVVMEHHGNEVTIVGGLLFFQAMTGINSILSYSTTIFLLAGFRQAVIGTMLIGAVRIVVAYLEFGLIDRLGRKTLLLIGTSVQGAIAAAAVLIYMCGFALGFGSVTWTVISEVLPTRIRMKTIGGFLSMNWFISLVITFLTLTAINGLGGVKPGMSDEEEADAKKKGVAILYLIFAAFNMSALIFLHVQLPETKGWNPEDREHIYSGKSQEGNHPLPLVVTLTTAQSVSSGCADNGLEMKAICS